MKKISAVTLTAPECLTLMKSNQKKSGLGVDSNRMKQYLSTLRPVKQITGYLLFRIKHRVADMLATAIIETN